MRGEINRVRDEKCAHITETIVYSSLSFGAVRQEQTVGRPSLTGSELRSISRTGQHLVRAIPNNSRRSQTISNELKRIERRSIAVTLQLFLAERVWGIPVHVHRLQNRLGRVDGRSYRSRVQRVGRVLREAVAVAEC